jgi:flagellar biosynthesis protein FlhF
MTGRQLAQPSLVRNRLVELISQRVTTVAPAQWQSGKCRIISLIGPTGVGKTTTIAKLAASFKLRQGLKVGLITIDTYRIAAVDQLKTYAQIIEVPLRVVLSADELKTAIGEMQNLDVLLIDTAGRSQNDQPRLNQLRAFLDAACPDEVHLVVSATANRRCARATVEKFMPLGVGRVIVTKLDEAACFGTVLNIPIAGNVALSYVTTGQDVPDDIALADPRRLADCIIEGRLQ